VAKRGGVAERGGVFTVISGLGDYGDHHHVVLGDYRPHHIVCWFGHQLHPGFFLRLLTNCLVTRTPPAPAELSQALVNQVLTNVEGDEA